MRHTRSRIGERINERINEAVTQRLVGDNQSRTFDLTYGVSIAPKRSDDFRECRHLPGLRQLKRAFQGGHSVIHALKYHACRDHASMAKYAH